MVVLGMVDVSRMGGAMAVRLCNLHAALQDIMPTVLLTGSRLPRRRALARYCLGGGLRRARAVYVEASTSTATETDLLFLALARRAGLPLIIFVPDAYQLFPDLYPRVGWKVKLLDWGWRRSIAAYLRLADMVVYPSWGLADCFENRQKVNLLPPAGLPDREYTPLAFEPPTIVYVGAATYNDGSDLLLSAMEQVVHHYPTARCRFITGNSSADILVNHPAYRAAWLTFERRTFAELPEVMRSTTVLVIPRRRNPYNDLAMPLKQFDYMSFGRPMVVTDCRETAALVNALESGVVVQDTPYALAQGVMKLLENRDLAMRLGQNGYRAIQSAHSWPHRAAQLLQMIEGLEQNTNVARGQQMTIEERR
jgi:glycosyltransferase involved in cell wall biosynthesis